MTKKMIPNQKLYTELRPVQKADVDQSKMLVYGIVATMTPDRRGDIVDTTKLSLEDHRANPIVLCEHAFGIARCEDENGNYSLSVTKNGIMTATSRFAPDVEISAQAFALIERGLMNGLSVHFVPHEYSFIEKGGIHWQTGALIEYSHCVLGVNQEALTLSVEKGMIGEEKLNPLLLRILKSHTLQPKPSLLLHSDKPKEKHGALFLRKAYGYLVATVDYLRDNVAMQENPVICDVSDEVAKAIDDLAKSVDLQFQSEYGEPLSESAPMVLDIVNVVDEAVVKRMSKSAKTTVTNAADFCSEVADCSGELKASMKTAAASHAGALKALAKDGDNPDKDEEEKAMQQSRKDKEISDTITQMKSVIARLEEQNRVLNRRLAKAEQRR